MRAFLKFLKDNGTLVALIVLMIIFSLWDEAFFTPRNLTNLARQTTIVGIIAVGMTLVIIINGIDLSVGSIVGLAAITVTLLMQSGINIWAAILLTLLLTGVLIGLVQIAVPYVVLPLIGMLASIDPALREAAASVGASKMRTFWTVTFPLSIPGVIAGTLIVFTLNAAAFAIPAMMGGGRVRMMGMMAYQQASINGKVPPVRGDFYDAFGHDSFKPLLIFSSF